MSNMIDLTEWGVPVKSIGARPFPDPQMDSQDSSTRSVELPSEIGTQEAEALRLELLALVASRAPIVVSCGRVQRIGTAGLQVLASVATTLRSNGASLTLREPTAALSDAARCLGLEALLGIA